MERNADAWGTTQVLDQLDRALRLLNEIRDHTPGFIEVVSAPFDDRFGFRHSGGAEQQSRHALDTTIDELDGRRHAVFARYGQELWLGASELNTLLADSVEVSG